MKALLCETCGSNKLIEENGIYVCQNCGTMHKLDNLSSQYIIYDPFALKEEREKKITEKYETQLKELLELKKTISEGILAKRHDISQINKEINDGNFPMQLKKKELLAKISELEVAKSKVGVLQSKRKKEIQTEIDNIRKAIPTDGEIEKESRKFTLEKRAELKKLNTELTGLQNKEKENNAQITELNKILKNRNRN